MTIGTCALELLSLMAILVSLSIFPAAFSHGTPGLRKFGYGTVTASTLIAWFVGVSFFMTTPRMRMVFGRMSKWPNRLSGAVFINFGLKLATEKAG